AETFLMGSPDTEEGRDEDEAQREVRIARPFAVAVTEVTRAQYEAVMGVPAHEGCVVESEGQQVPAVCVTWFEAVRFANRLSTIEGLTPVYEIVGSSVTWKPTPSRKVGYRLLTEREWEYAARAETQTVFVGTSDPTGACDWANVSDRSRGGSFLCDDGFPRLAPVENRMRPNVWRLAGFGGNAAEWVWDWYAEKPPDAARGPETGQSRVFRGGSWYDSPQSARVADRGRNGPSARYSLVGFRLARSCHPSAVSPSKCFAPQAE
ncbi:MAG: formylglycine-generating enzyme family protein, partial [Pseudomonadota bacterium]